MSTFVTVGDANLLAYKNSDRQNDILVKKQEILDTLSEFHNFTPTTVLYIGFSSFIFADYGQNIYVTEISDQAYKFLVAAGKKFTYIPKKDLAKYAKQFDVVVAVDEYFTYASSDSEQRNQVAEICLLAKEFVITTVKDYKNQDYKDREFSQPSIVRSGSNNIIFLENHTWNPQDRARWTSVIHAIDNANGLTTFGPFERHTMYFKQLANFSNGAGADEFLVHKNLMYKGLVKKNYEHVITIKFD